LMKGKVGEQERQGREGGKGREGRRAGVFLGSAPDMS
jgi:hypothetical protein